MMSMVHDNVIRAYSVDFEAETLNMNTVYITDYVHENTDVVFTGYLTHSFDCVMRGSIIFDILEYPSELFFKNEAVLLEEKKPFGWPISYETKSELIEYLQTHEYKIFEISSSLGLCGLVFAKQMEIIVNDEGAR